MCFLIAPHLPSLPRYDSLDLGPWQLCSTECDDLDADAVERDDLDADAVERDDLDEGLRMYRIICIVQHYIINTVKGGGGTHCMGYTLWGVHTVCLTQCARCTHWRHGRPQEFFQGGANLWGGGCPPKICEGPPYFF